jgi:hypothetical protein
MCSNADPPLTSIIKVSQIGFVEKQRLQIYANAICITDYKAPIPSTTESGF